MSTPVSEQSLFAALRSLSLAVAVISDLREEGMARASPETRDLILRGATAHVREALAMMEALQARATQTPTA